MALEMDELIEGVPAGSEFAKAWFESAARDMQLNLVDTKCTTRQSDRLAARDQLVGDKQTAEIRRAGIAQDADFILQVKVPGRHIGSRVLSGTPVQVFSLSADLRALRTDTGQVLVSIPMPTEEVPSRNQAVDGAARQFVHAMLEGEFVFARATTHYLQFVRAPEANPQKQNIAPPRVPVPPAGSPKESSAPGVAVASTVAANSALPSWAWVLGLFGAVAMLAGGFLLGRRTPQTNRR